VEDRLRYEGWRVVAACSVMTIFAPIPLIVFPVFLKAMSEHFAWSREATASAYGAMTILAALSGPWVGLLLDRAGARRVILPCLAVSGCAVASLSLLTPALWHVRAVFALIGLVTIGASPIASSRVIFGWFDAMRGRAMGLVLAGAGFSGIVAPAIAQALIRTVGWRIAWLLLGSSTLVIALPIAALFIRERAASARVAALASSDLAVRVALRTRVFWTMTIVVFASTFATSGASVHIVALLADRGVPAGQAALAVSGLGGASLAGRLLTGWLVDRFDAARVSMLLLIVAAIGMFLLAQAQSLAAGMAAAICIGFGAGGEVDVTPYLLSRHFGLRSLSTLYGLSWTAWGLGGALGAVVLGRSFDATGSYAAALAVLAAITLGAAAAMWSLPPVPAPARHSEAAPQAV
jgi:MFS family permease